MVMGRETSGLDLLVSKLREAFRKAAAGEEVDLYQLGPTDRLAFMAEQLAQSSNRHNLAAADLEHTRKVHLRTLAEHREFMSKQSDSDQ